VQINGARLHYVQMEPEGGGECEDLVMVHGLATSMAFWYFQYAGVFSKRFRVTLYDLRGHGRSEMTEGGYTPENLARDLQGLMDHLGIQRAHILAHSFGGVIAMNFAALEPHRVASLVLADTHICAARRPGPTRDWHHGREIQAILDAHQVPLNAQDPFFGYRLLTEVARLLTRADEVPADLMQLASPLLAKHGKRTAEQWLKLMEQTQAEAQMMGDDGLTLDVLRRFGFPILAMYGDHSQARLTGRELLNVWPHAEFRRVRDAGHFFPTSRAEEMISGCERFWQGEFARKPRYRTGEPGQRYFRSDRLVQENGAWYCFTREKTRIGPFARQEEAHEQLATYISAIQAAAAAVA
jgi:pimeloyl-ACP methyl ester carboxylesterase